jgi:hypothetical protein
MTSERRARDTYTEIQRLNMAVQTLSETSQLGLPVKPEDIFALLQMTRICSYHASRALDSAHRDERRRTEDTRFPPFDGVDDAQQAAAVVAVVAAAGAAGPSLGEQVRQALAGEQA